MSLNVSDLVVSIDEMQQGPEKTAEFILEQFLTFIENKKKI